MLALYIFSIFISAILFYLSFVFLFIFFIDLNFFTLLTSIFIFILAIAIIIVTNLIPIKPKKKNRSIYQIRTKKSPSVTEEIIISYLKSYNYKLGIFNNEHIYKFGEGFFVDRRFIKYFIDEDIITFEVFVTKMGLFWTPSKEFSFNNHLIGAFAKQKILKMIENIDHALND